MLLPAGRRSGDQQDGPAETAGWRRSAHPATGGIAFAGAGVVHRLCLTWLQQRPQQYQVGIDRGGDQRPARMIEMINFTTLVFECHRTGMKRLLSVQDQGHERSHPVHSLTFKMISFVSVICNNCFHYSSISFRHAPDASLADHRTVGPGPVFRLLLFVFFSGSVGSRPSATPFTEDARRRKNDL